MVRPNELTTVYKAKFNTINERPVDDISLELFYKPHTITLLAVSIAAVVYFSFIRDEGSLDDNIRAGVCCVVFFFVIISVLAFPNGPFTRPHPAFWRIVFGLSVLYLLSLVFLLFQNYKTVMSILYWIDPELEHFHIDMDKIAFAHLLPNFIECWWDALILDVLLCNGLGIWLGLKICKILEMREYKWVSIKDIHSTTGKLKRVVLQFTPGSWTHVRWLDPTCTYMRFFAICQLVIFWQICELNTFFLKHIFEMPPSHPLVIWRLILVGIVVAPSVRQYYTYVTDPQCKRVGTQCWVYGAIMATEALLCIKNGKELFSHTQAINIIFWLLLISLLSILCVYGCVLWHKYFQTGDNEFSHETSPCKSPSLSFSESESRSEIEGHIFENSDSSALKRRQINVRNGLNEQS
ncbi:phosphatidylserine synthase 1 homolog l(3)77CDf isoform X6 [Lycorma delicatula]|uniref:phosphatidylserine synthase 1 homolog l(3)77CDf isoform X6 n=1 Tax=Lycorma delicatula TaxID=130591 RepID=UPI003F511C87